MRWLLLALVACGAEPKQPLLANAPHPDNAAVAGVAAGAAAAAVLADPNAATRGKPEKPKDDGEKNPVEVKESVPADVLDRADQQKQPTAPKAKPAAAAPRKGPPPKIPSPSEEAARQNGN